MLDQPNLKLLCNVKADINPQKKLIQAFRVIFDFVVL